jgi:hypothetical protein
MPLVSTRRTCPVCELDIPVSKLWNQPTYGLFKCPYCFANIEYAYGWRIRIRSTQISIVGVGIVGSVIIDFFAFGIPGWLLPSAVFVSLYALEATLLFKAPLVPAMGFPVYWRDPATGKPNLDRRKDPSPESSES